MVLSSSLVVNVCAAVGSDFIVSVIDDFSNNNGDVVGDNFDGCYDDESIVTATTMMAVNHVHGGNDDDDDVDEDDMMD